jgi:hypothetical protein
VPVKKSAFTNDTALGLGLIVAIVVVLALGAVLITGAIKGGSGVAAASATATATPMATSTASPSPTPTATPEPTPSPTATPTPAPTGPKTFPVGTPVYLTTDDGVTPWGTVTVSDVKTAAYYKGSYGYQEKPEVAGNVFISAKVTYEAAADGITYNPYDWEVFCDGMAVGSSSYALYGPQPALHSGTLPSGRKASGYVVYEVPPKGEVRMSYGASAIGGRGPVFEVIIRAA